MSVVYRARTGMLGEARRLLRPLRRAATTALERARWGLRYNRLGDNSDHATHLKAASDWLVRAQDAGVDRGVSYGAVFGQGFQESYPETTGYIIPTFLELARHYQDDSFRRRAIEMGDWEMAIQMPEGAVMGGKVNRSPKPAVFNTGQVLLGFAALVHEVSEPRFADAARRACRWLVEIQEPNGNWLLGNSTYANPHATLYNVKAAWGLAAAGRAIGDSAAVDAAIRNGEYCLTQQASNGWFANCCLEDPEKPLLHTIAYTMQGLLGIGQLTGRSDFIAAASLTASQLVALMDADGFIPGRIDASFRGQSDWCCLTGTAQTAIVWSELYALTGDQRFRAARSKANQYLMRRHNLTDSDPAIRGGVFGSWPVWGSYGQLAVLNWATKFFIDSLLLQMRQEHMTSLTTKPPDPKP